MSMSTGRTAEDWIKALNLVEHPGEEEGYFAECYRDGFIVKNGLEECRNIATVAYFLQKVSPPFTADSFLFRCAGTEMIFYHAGCSLSLKIFNKGVHKEPLNVKVGAQIEKGEVPFYAIPKNTWFTRLVESENAEDFCLYSCSLVPGFELADFTAKKFGELLEPLL